MPAKTASGLFSKYRGCIARLTIESPEGDSSNGTSFHIGDGYMVTARHCVEGNEIVSMLREGSDEPIAIRQVHFHSNSEVDLALLETDFEFQPRHLRGMEEESTRIELTLFEDFMPEEVTLLSSVLLFGYPRIPLSSKPVLVTLRGEVNAVIDKVVGQTKYPYIIVSPTARPGFSGGPVLSQHGTLIGVFLESLISDGCPTELGFGAAISADAVWSLIEGLPIGKRLQEEFDQMVAQVPRDLEPPKAS